jgi:hypothetical protein
MGGDEGRIGCGGRRHWEGWLEDSGRALGGGAVEAAPAMVRDYRRDSRASRSWGRKACARESKGLGGKE